MVILLSPLPLLCPPNTPKPSLGRFHSKAHQESVQVWLLGRETRQAHWRNHLCPKASSDRDTSGTGTDQAIQHLRHAPFTLLVLSRCLTFFFPFLLKKKKEKNRRRPLTAHESVLPTDVQRAGDMGVHLCCPLLVKERQQHSGWSERARRGPARCCMFISAALLRRCLHLRLPVAWSPHPEGTRTPRMGSRLAWRRI